MSVRHHCLFR